jgi:hypothetical protein
MGRTAYLSYCDPGGRPSAGRRLPKWRFSPMDARIAEWKPWGMETATDSSSAEAHEAHEEPMLKLTIRCHPAVPVESDELESWLTAQVSELRAGAPRAIIRLSRLTQHFASSDAAIGWLLELEMPEGSSLLNEGRLTRVMADMRLLGIEPTPLAAVDSANGVGALSAR